MLLLPSWIHSEKHLLNFCTRAVIYLNFVTKCSTAYMMFWAKEITGRGCSSSQQDLPISKIMAGLSPQCHFPALTTHTLTTHTNIQKAIDLCLEFTKWLSLHSFLGYRITKFRYSVGCFLSAFAEFKYVSNLHTALFGNTTSLYAFYLLRSLFSC